MTYFHTYNFISIKTRRNFFTFLKQVLKVKTNLLKRKIAARSINIKLELCFLYNLTLSIKLLGGTACSKYFIEEFTNFFTTSKYNLMKSDNNGHHRKGSQILRKHSQKKKVVNISILFAEGLKTFVYTIPVTQKIIWHKRSSINLMDFIFGRHICGKSQNVFHF